MWKVLVARITPENAISSPLFPSSFFPSFLPAEEVSVSAKIWAFMSFLVAPEKQGDRIISVAFPVFLHADGGDEES